MQIAKTHTKRLALGIGIVLLVGLGGFLAVTLSGVVDAGGVGGKAKALGVCVDQTTGAMRVGGKEPCDPGESKVLVPKGRFINADTVDGMHACILAPRDGGKTVVMLWA
jgi:hypothetical protein